MVQSESKGSEGSSVFRLELIGKTLSLVVLVLPALGLGVRWAAFALTGAVAPSLPIAAAQSFSELVAAGTLYASVALLVGLGVLLFNRTFHEATRRFTTKMVSKAESGRRGDRI